MDEVAASGTPQHPRHPHAPGQPPYRPAAPWRSESGWLCLLLGIALGAWFCYNRFVMRIYPADPSEHGRFQVVSYGSDYNPARINQLNIFNQYYRGQGIKAALVPGGSDMDAIITASAAQAAPDIIESYAPEDIRTFISKGIVRPLNGYLRSSGIDLDAITWPTRLDELRVPNPAWSGGGGPLDQYLYYAVPNNVEVMMVFFNNSLYQQVRAERTAAGLPMPPQPWLHWTWWDYAMLARAMHRRSASGQFLTFGGASPECDMLYHQIGESMRGESRPAFDALSDRERRERGLEGLSWDACTQAWQQLPDGSYRPYPNRVALAQALQFDFDLVNTLHGSPSASDLGQMASSGSINGDTGHGQFVSGQLGMHMTGRWFLGQVRAYANFDWRLYRAPRWVPLEEWQRWQRLGLPPERRDGPWGEQEHPERGYAVPLGGRMACISSSARDPAKAFTFLEFLVTNRDFNHVLLVEDGMGADRGLSLEYLAKPDPLFPHESVHRPIEHELGAVSHTYARDRWPYPNYHLGRDMAYADLATPFNDEGFLRDRVGRSGCDIDYEAFRSTFPDIGHSSTAIGQDLAGILIPKLDQALQAGSQLQAPARPQGPSREVQIGVALAGLLVGAVAILLHARSRSLRWAHAR